MRKRSSTPKSAPVALPFAVSASLRVAQLSPGPKFENAQPLIPKRWSDLQALAPNVVIGSLSEMKSLAVQVSAQALDAAFIDRAIVILTRFGLAPLNDVARVGLWQSFGVPIFELYLALDQALLASECEAHEGWHLVSGVGAATLETGELIFEGAGNSGLRTGLRASIDRTTCPCGRATPRVLEIERLPSFDARFLAVSA